jgi:molybdopterin molybdotransferase
MAKHIMKGFDSLLSYNDALSSFSNEIWKYPDIEEINIAHASGKISAESIISKTNIPDNNKSAMDGYAVISTDTIGASNANPVKLILKGINAAGDYPGNKLYEGQCMEIYTGAIVPSSSDAVVKAENCEAIDGYVYIYSPINSGDNIVMIGEDIKNGDIIAYKNTTIYPQNLASLKALGINTIKVYRNIVIGIINTGKELINGQIENSTGMILNTFYTSNFTETIDGGIVDDDISSIRGRVKSIIDKCDILIITGGSSLGKRDMTTEALSMEGKMIFSGISIRPGRTLALFKIHNRMVLSASGLPVAALISSMIFVNQYIKDLYGIEYIHKSCSILDENIHTKIGFTTFQIASTYSKKGELYSTPLKTTSSGMISALIHGNSIIKIDDNTEGLEQGTRANIYIMGDIKWD